MPSLPTHLEFGVCELDHWCRLRPRLRYEWPALTHSPLASVFLEGDGAVTCITVTLLILA